jgi:hypothetical protein
MIPAGFGDRRHDPPSVAAARPPLYQGRMAHTDPSALWHETLLALQKPTVDMMRTHLQRVAEAGGSDAAMILAFMAAGDVGTVTGPVVAELKRALDRIAPTDPTAVHLLKLLRDT